MPYLFEKSDLLNTPVECFYFDAEKEKFPVRPHWHYYMEIIYMLEGTALMYDGSTEYTVSEGEMLLFHPQSVHSIYAADGFPLRYAVIKLDINRMNMSSSYSPKLRSVFKYAEKNGMNIFFSSEAAREADAERIFLRCIAEMKAQKYSFELVVRSDIYRLLIGILRSWQSGGFIIDSEAFAEDSRYDVFNITEYIDENMSGGIKVSDIAGLCKMSYSYFAKQFLSVYGKTCKEYIEEMRIYKVEEFLVFTDFDLTYISQETGFSDCSHMIKSFKRHRGITPKQFRMQNALKTLPGGISLI